MEATQKTHWECRFPTSVLKYGYPVETLCSCCYLKRHPLQISHKQDWGQEFILLLPQDVVLPRSDAVSDCVKPALGFIIQNHQISCSMWCPTYGHAIRMQFVKGHCTCNLVKSKTPFVHRLMELPSLLVILSLAQLFGASLIQHAWHWYWMYSHSASCLLCNLSA